VARQATGMVKGKKQGHQSKPGQGKRRDAASNPGRESFRQKASSGYGEEDMDDVLQLNESASERASDSEREEDIMLKEDDDDDEDWDDVDDEEEEAGGFKKALQETKTPGKSGRAEEKLSRKEAKTVAQEAVERGTAGWQRTDFYGGEDVDSEDEGSDEELNFEEAKRLEERRAQRLGLAGADPLAVLLGGDEATATTAAAGETPAAAAEAAASEGTAAKFESLFAEGAEAASVPRDLSQLSESRRKKLVRSEAPELAPLLADFKDKLASLKELLPLLAPESLSKLPESGAAYLDSKLNLLLNTLANLSYYTLLRAEGVQVRSHPVVSQLVWLKELHENLAPLDSKLRVASRRAAKAVRKAGLKGTAFKLDQEQDLEDEVVEEAEQAASQPPRRPSIRERLLALKAAQAQRGAATAVASRGASLAAAAELPATADLLALPGKTKRGSGSRSGAPADLHEVDPTVGAFMPKSTLGAAVMGAQQYISDVASRAVQRSADQDVEPKQRRSRHERGQKYEEEEEKEPVTMGVALLEDLPESKTQARKKKQQLGSGFGSGEEGGDDDPIVRAAREKAARRREKKTEKERQRQEHAKLRQFKPVVEVEGRRKTSQKILRNKGLVRQRKKDAANSRVNNRKKYEKGIKRRKGAVQEMRAGAEDGVSYAGEATGVRTHLKKSLKLS